MDTRSNNWQKWANVLLKGGVVVALGWVLYQHVDLDVWAVWRAENDPERWKGLRLLALVGAVLLMPVNWSLEALKWQTLVWQFAPLRFRQCLAGVLAGVTISLFTPNRIGEYGGRILLVEARHNWRAVIATLVGSFSQLLMIWSFGLLAALYYLVHFAPSDWLDFRWWWILVAVFVGVLFAVFFSLNGLERWTETRWGKYGRKVWKQLRVLRRFHSRHLLRVILFSGLRFLVYSLQYALIVWFLDDSVSLLMELSCIGTLFLLQTGLPFPPLLGLVARGELAVLIWAGVGIEAGVALAASYGLFILNLLLPALVGTAIIVRINVMKSIGYEPDHAQ